MAIFQETGKPTVACGFPVIITSRLPLPSVKKGIIAIYSAYSIRQPVHICKRIQTRGCPSCCCTAACGDGEREESGAQPPRPQSRGVTSCIPVVQTFDAHPRHGPERFITIC